MRSLPIVPTLPVNVGTIARRRIDRIARKLLQADPVLRDPRWRRPEVASGVTEGPALIFEDHREIHLLGFYAPRFEYRGCFLAGLGDLVVISEERDRDFEDYCRNSLGLGSFDIRDAPPDGNRPIGLRCMDDPGFMDDLVGRARFGGAMTIVPYVGRYGAWLLAERLAAESGVPMRVSAPPPELTERTNNKLWFAQRAREVLGPDSVPVTNAASDPRELQIRLRRLARIHPRLVVKVPASAGGRGVLQFDAAAVRAMRGEATVRSVHEQLASVGWEDTFPLVIGAWEQPVLLSPSVQMWVPHEGDPLVEGVFDQRLEEETAAFAGGISTSLPPDWQLRLARESAMLALLFQRLGYFGRCSFDALLIGDDLDSARLHWVECNGRWGGMSLALTAANRLVGDFRRRPFALAQLDAELRCRRTFREVLDVIGGAGFHRRTDETGAVVLTPRQVMDGTGLSLLVMGHTPDDARQEAFELAGRFL